MGDSPKKVSAWSKLRDSVQDEENLKMRNFIIDSVLKPGPKSELDFNKDHSTKATYQETSEQEVKQRLKSYADIKKHATSGGKDLKDMKELCYIEIEGEMNFANYAFWCFPLTTVVAKNRVKSAKLSYDFGHYDRAIEYTKEAFQY